jgi:hypothetical protein
MRVIEEGYRSLHSGSAVAAFGATPALDRPWQTPHWPVRDIHWLSLSFALAAVVLTVVPVPGYRAVHQVPE